jgi:hypothetical protein
VYGTENSVLINKLLCQCRWQCLEYSAVKSCWSRPTFQGNILPPSSGWWVITLMMAVLVPWWSMFLHGHAIFMLKNAAISIRSVYNTRIHALKFSRKDITTKSNSNIFMMMFFWVMIPCGLVYKTPMFWRNTMSPSSGLWQYVAPKHGHIPASPHSITTQIIIFLIMRTSNLTAKFCTYYSSHIHTTCTTPTILNLSTLIQIIKLLIMSLCPPSSFFLSLWSIYSHCPFLKQPQLCP